MKTDLKIVSPGAHRQPSTNLTVCTFGHTCNAFQSIGACPPASSHCFCSKWSPTLHTDNWDRNLSGGGPPWTSRAKNVGLHISSLWAPKGTPSTSSPIMPPSKSKESQTWGNWLSSLICCRPWSVVSWSVSYTTCIKLLRVHWLGSCFWEPLSYLYNFLSQVPTFSIFKDKARKSNFRARDFHECLCFLF